MRRAVDEQRLDGEADAQILELALGCHSLARETESLARSTAEREAAMRTVPGDDRPLLACLGLLSLSRTLAALLPLESDAPGATPHEGAPAVPRTPGLLR